MRVGRDGLRVPASFIEGLAPGVILSYRLVKDFLANLRRADVEV